MVMPMNNILTLYDNNQKIDYKMLFVLDKEFKYIIYTDLDNMDLNKLYAIKVKALNNNEETIPITDEEWTMIETEFNKFIKK